MLSRVSDVHSKKVRSKNMAAIRSTNTKPEKIVFSELRHRKVSFQKHYEIVRISIDIARPRNKRAVFIDGDFWHGYRFSVLRRRLPGGYWTDKIAANIKRDQKNRKKLRKAGWGVLRIWEHEIKKDLEGVVRKMEIFLKT